MQQREDGKARIEDRTTGKFQQMLISRPDEFVWL